MSTRPPIQPIIPSRVLLELGDHDGALHGERIRGFRSAQPAALPALLAEALERTVCDARHGHRLPGTRVRREGDPESSDPPVNQAYDGAGITHDFFSRVLGRNSVDGRGFPLVSTVHYGTNFNNAFWNGRQMIYGDGDNKLFSGFTRAIDVIAHELTHGVTQFTVPGGLDYSGQSGALNESFSDVFGSVVKQWHLDQDVTQADWLIGSGIMMPAAGKALRSMKDPGNPDLTWRGDDQPKSMDGYVNGGDVHTNSGIPNHAFYLAATALGGHAWEKAAPIWYRALPLLTPESTFRDAAHATIHAVTLLGLGQQEKLAVSNAWKAVKVL